MRIRLPLFAKFMLTYICVLVLALIGGLVINFKYAEILESQTERYNEVILQQSQKVLDEKFLAIEKLLYDAFFSTEINNFLYASKSQSSYYYDMYVASRELSGMTLNSKVAQEFAPLNIYLYQARSDVVIDGTSKYDVEYYFSQVARYNDMNLQEWKDLQLRYKWRASFSRKRAAFGGVLQDVITCTNTLPLAPANSNLGTLGIMVPTEPFQEVLKAGIIDKEGAAFVLDEEGTVLISAGSAAFPGIDLLSGPSGLYSYSDDENQAIVTRLPSSTGKFTYISVIPASIYLRQIRSMQNTTAAIIVIMLLIGALLSLLFARNHTVSIKMLVTSLKQHAFTRSDLSNSANELDYIGKTVLSVLAENNSVKQKMEDYLPLLQSSLITQLLKGDNPDSAKTVASLEASGIYLDKTLFCAIAISLVGGKYDTADVEYDAAGNSANLARFAASNVVSEVAGQLGVAYSAAIGLEYIAILAGSDLECASFEEKLEAKLREAMVFLQEHMGIYLRFGIGTPRSVGDIHISFREARTACDLSLYDPLRDIVKYQDIEVSSQSYSYPVETEMQIISSVKNGSKERMRELLQEVISENFKVSKLPLELARCLFFDIMSTAIKILGEMRIAYNEAFDAEPMRLLTSCKNISEMENVLIRIFDGLCEIANNKQTSHNEKLKESLVECIDKNFQNPDLCLNSIVDIFHLSPAYISRFFKESVGINFVDYLRAKRIDKAVWYLKNTDMQVNGIAERVGYTSSVVFIRNFKKIHGITPGEMRIRL